MTCAACIKRGKTWNGGDAICSFPNGAEFDPAGWNCATANAIRNLCGQDDQHLAADHRYCDDQYYSTIKIDEIRLPSGSALALWVSWYKHRGRTEAMWLLSENNPPRRPTEADCMAIVAALEPIDETQNDESINPAPLLRCSAALIATGRPIQLWGLDRLTHTDQATYRRDKGLGPCAPACPSELFGLACALLAMMFRAILVRAKDRLRMENEYPSPSQKT